MTSTQKTLLIVGDMAALAAATLIGFATHDSLATAGVRILATLLPVLAGWFLLAPLLGVYSDEVALAWPQLWRPAWAVVLGSPLAALLRSVWLNRPVLVVFVAIIAAVNALAIMIWRVLFLFLVMRKPLWTKSP